MKLLLFSSPCTRILSPTSYTSTSVSVFQRKALGSVRIFALGNGDILLYSKYDDASITFNESIVWSTECLTDYDLNRCMGFTIAPYSEVHVFTADYRTTSRRFTLLKVSLDWYGWTRAYVYVDDEKLYELSGEATITIDRRFRKISLYARNTSSYEIQNSVCELATFNLESPEFKHTVRFEDGLKAISSPLSVYTIIVVPNRSLTLSVFESDVPRTCSLIITD